MKKWIKQLKIELDNIRASFRRNTIARAFCVILAVILGVSAFLFGLLVPRTDSSKSNVVTASAETSVNWHDYPSANLIDMDPLNVSVNGGYYVNTYTKYVLVTGKTYTLSFDCTIYKMSDYSTGATLPRMYLSVGTSTSSSSFGTSRCYVNYKPSTLDLGVTFRMSCTFTVPASTATTYMAIRFFNTDGMKANVNMDIESIQLNVGSVAYPYIPPLKSVCQDFYDDGYRSGYIEGLGVSQNGFWEYCKVIVSGYADGESFNKSYTPWVSNNVANLIGVCQDLKTLDISVNFTQLKFTLYFDPYVNIATFDLFLSSGFSILPEDSAGIRVGYVPYEGYPIYYNEGVFEFDEGNQRYHLEFDKTDVHEIYYVSGFIIPDIEQLRYVRFGTGYSSGFEAGYQLGTLNSDSFGDGYAEGKADGITEGKKLGKLEALETITKDDPYGINDFMYSVLDMPGRIVYNALNFDVFGVNLAGLVFFVVTVLLLGFIVKKVF